MFRPMNAAASMFRTDRTGLLLIALLGLSLPSLALWSAFRLVNGLAFAPNGTGETLAAVGCVATAIGGRAAAGHGTAAFR